MQSVSDDEYVAIMSGAELAAGQMRGVVLGGRAVLVCRTREGLHAVDAVCTHAYARLDEGRLRGQRLICPLHGAAFDVRTGAVLGAPATVPLACHAARERDGRIEVRLVR